MTQFFKSNDIYSIEVNEEQPFENDLLNNRQEVATQLNTLIEEQYGKTGGVISIEGKWGDGKTTFLEMWMNQLSNTDFNFPVIYYNAFIHDYNEEPFISITKAIYTFLKNSSLEATKKKKLKDDLIKSSKAFIKRHIEKIGNGIISDETLSNFFDDDSLETKIKNTREVLEEITDDLYLNNRNKPLIFIIDELDRCRPNFCLEIIEKVKHIFGIPKIVWVLAINRQQVEESIKHVYGTLTNTHLYLNKFINETIELPPSRPKQLISFPQFNGSTFFIDQTHYERLYQKYFQLIYEFDIKFKNELKSIIEALSILSHFLKPGIREVQKITNRTFKVLKGLIKYDNVSYLIAFLSSLSVTHPARYHQLINKNIKYLEIQSFFESLGINETNNEILEIYGIIKILFTKSLDDLHTVEDSWDTQRILNLNDCSTIEFAKDNYEYLYGFSDKIFGEIGTLIGTGKIDN